MIAGFGLRGLLATAFVLAIGATAAVHAHEVTHRGTVLAVEPARLQVQTLTESGAEGEATWFTVTEKTKVQRGEQVVTYVTAAIATGERIVVIVDHDADEHAAIELRLAARPAE